MRFSTVAGLASATLVAAQAPSITQYTSHDIHNGQAFQNVSDIADEAMRSNIASRGNVQCTYENADVRREWRTLSQHTRKSFTDAVLCLQQKAPEKMTAAEAPYYPGVKTRWDEYVATHINYTLNIHDTADFLAWHRAFTHYLEQDLKNLCGYTGVMPYWNWALDYASPQDSPLFNGDEYSMSGNGESISGRSDTWLAQQEVDFPPGTGGGCVTSGPFKDYTVNLGPLDLPNANNVNSTFEYNPRCLERDLNPWVSTNYNTYRNLTDLLLENTHIEDFQAIMQGYNSDTNRFGVHGGGHWQVGGSMMDFHSSPADPVFFLHHAMIDRVWTIWQNLDIYRRQNTLMGTATLGCDVPDCPAMTLEDSLPFGFVTDDPVFGDLMDTFSGPFCYRYDSATS
ncbi:Di-copper centre-containing [Lecanosticta acicola]|uniref:Di-copper centre-containing n=1 Tax=Lecanosticta acicola TaxID=111012 RepID=A0AAI8Z489_9PEZI|nr:Di-copper centre-containing [Lecanosticta acicola]